MPTPQDNLTAAIANLAQIIANQTAAWVAAGAPPTFSIDGESYQWGNWLAEKTEQLEKLRESQQMIGGPWIVRGRGRA